MIIYYTGHRNKINSQLRQNNVDNLNDFNFVVCTTSVLSV